MDIDPELRAQLPEQIINTLEAVSSIDKANRPVTPEFLTDLQTIYDSLLLKTEIDPEVLKRTLLRVHLLIEENFRFAKIINYYEVKQIKDGLGPQIRGATWGPPTNFRTQS